jgi:hypothetical protein
MYTIDTFVRDAHGDTANIVSPCKVRTGIEINKKLIPTQSLYKIS